MAYEVSSVVVDTGRGLEVAVLLMASGTCISEVNDWFADGGRQITVLAGVGFDVAVSDASGRIQTVLGFLDKVPATA